jgi:transcriptional regulator with XRE-family HTH domain
MNIQEAIGKTLVFYREKACLSQEELAHKANLHRTFISQIERGLKMPTLLSIFKISKALEITPTQFISTLEDNLNVSL